MKKIIILILFTQCLHAKQSSQNIYHYMLANYEQFAGKLKDASHLYSQIDPEVASNYIYLGYVPFLAATDADAQIVTLIPQLDETFKNNLNMQLLFASALEKTGKKNDGYSRLIMLNEQNKSNQELAFKVAQIYLARSEPENALKVIDNLLNTSARRPNNYIFHFMKAQVFLQLNKKPEALAAVKQCIEIYPKFDKSWLLYAVLHEQEGKLEEAIKGYTTFLETSNEPNGEIQRHLLSLAFRQKLVNSKMGIADNGKGCLTQAAQLFDKQEYTKALAQIDLCLVQTPNDSEARLMKIQVLVNQNQFDAATSLLADWIIHGDDKELWLQTLHLLTYAGLSYKKALSTLASIEKNKIKSAALALYQADFALRDNNQKQALIYLEKAEQMVKDAATKMHIALQKAIIYYDQQNWPLSQKTLEEAHNLDKNYPPANNLLAYIYAHNNDDLPKAIQLINQALAKDPHNPHFLDTKALILYNQNDFDQATQLLQKAAQACPTDFTILNHLGKCQFKKGDTSLALQSMKAASAVAKNDQQKLRADKFIAAWSNNADAGLKH